MAIEGPATYLPTMDLFLAHWADVDALLGVGLELKVGQPSAVAGAVPVLVARAGLATLRANLQTLRNSVTATAQNLSIRREELRDRKAALLARFHQFSSMVRSRYTDRAYERALPQAPGVGEALEKFAEPLVRVDALWVTINGTLGANPLQLGAGSPADPFYTQSGHWALDIVALRTAATAEQTLQQQLKILIERRNDLQDEIAPLLRDYRKAVQGRFSSNHALVESLPRYSPLPGTKPAAPQITAAQWNAGTAKAEVAFTPSTSGNVVRHELRVVPGPVYDADLETIDGTLAVGQPPVFHSSSLLGAPGDVVTYVVVAVNGEDQERASDPATVQRP